MDVEPTVLIPGDTLVLNYSARTGKYRKDLSERLARALVLGWPITFEPLTSESYDYAMDNVQGVLILTKKNPVVVGLVGK